MFNIALEHAILKYSADNLTIPTVRIWRSKKSIVMGRNQNIEDEINLNYCLENGIEITRRISGGGAVYHDLGNLNVSFFLSPLLKKRLRVNNIQEITSCVTFLLLDSLKIDYTDIINEGNSNIFYQGKKISGSAGYMYRNWYLHHATLLESVNIEHLNNSLLARESNPESKKQSRYFETTNLPHFNQKNWITNLKQILNLKHQINFIKSDLFDEEVELANTLQNELYAKSTWIYEGKRKKI